MNNGPLLNSGSTGKDVKRLQRILVMKKMLMVNQITGTYDAVTKDRVKDFQTEVGLTADGIAGPATWAKLPADPNTPLLKSGSTGTAVTALQTFFKSIAPPNPDPGPIDGKFGPKMIAATKVFQHEVSVTEDGIVGDNTWWSPAGAAGATLASLSGLTTS